MSKRACVKKVRAHARGRKVETTYLDFLDDLLLCGIGVATVYYGDYVGLFTLDTVNSGPEDAFTAATGITSQNYVR